MISGVPGWKMFRRKILKGKWRKFLETTWPALYIFQNSIVDMTF